MKVKMKYIAVAAVSGIVATSAMRLYKTHQINTMIRTYNRNHQNSPLLLSKKRK